jgi:hypothetical protein
MKSLLLVLTFCTLSFFSKGQSQKGTIQGILIDTTTAQPLPYATVSIFRANDTTLISYRLSDEKGGFRVTAVPAGVKLRMIINYMGSTIYRKEMQLQSGQQLLDLGKLRLQTSAIDLNEVMVRAERPPVVVRKDTIEFNAAAFKTLPDALVEDLLRKLPGVNVDKDGNIMVNGRKVTTIYVDGKEFFGGDVHIASKNLPANTIDKIQVTNDKEALQANPLMREADIPQVINLKLKPGIKRGVFGKAYAGAGVKNKAEIGGLLNFFRDTTQLSVLGYGNNLNKASFSFTDIRSVGGFGRSGWGNANGNGTGGLSIDKVSFGGFGNGLMTSSGGGGNFNTIINKKIDFSFNYFYGAVVSDYDELRNTQQLYNDTILNSRQNTNQHTSQYAHLVGTKIGFNINSHLHIEFRPQLIFVKENTNQFFNLNTTSNVKGALSTSDNNQDGRNNSTTFMSWLKVLPTFTKKGRSMFFVDALTIDNSKNNLYNLIQNSFYQPPAQSTVNQLRKNDVVNTRNFILLTYSDLLSPSFNFSSSITSNYFRNENDLGTFFPDTFDQYVIGVPALTQDYERTGHRTDATVGFKWKLKKWSFGSGIDLAIFDAKSVFSTGSPVNQHYRFLLPSFDLGYDVFNLTYNRNFSEPALANIQPIINNTNSLFIRNGNPDLKPSVSNSLTFSLRKYDTKTLLTYNFNIGGSVIDNATIVSRTINGAAVQTTIPINTNGVWSLSNNLGLQKDWKMENNKQVSFIASNSSSLYNSFVMLNNVKSGSRTLNVRPLAEVRVNLNDKFELTQSYFFTYYHSSYESAEFSSQTLNYHDTRSEVIFRAGQHWVWETQLDHRYNPNAVPGLLQSYYKWNAAITYVFLPGNRGQLKLAVNDILDQNVLATRMIRENLIEDMQGSTIRRYGLLTFTYNIRNFGDKVGGRNQLFRF